MNYNTIAKMVLQQILLLEVIWQLSESEKIDLALIKGNADTFEKSPSDTLVYLLKIDLGNQVLSKKLYLIK
jgi:hypothetical protein